jgi:hypothetical protein
MGSLLNRWWEAPTGGQRPDVQVTMERQFRVWLSAIAATCVLFTGDSPRVVRAATTYTVSFQTYDDHWVSPLCCGQDAEVWADSPTKVPIVLTDLNGGTLANNGDQVTLHTTGLFGGPSYFTTANGNSPIWTDTLSVSNKEKWRIYQPPYN